jgi:ribose transport system permease protein
VVILQRIRHGEIGLERFSGLYLWALFIAVFSIWQPALFLDADTARIIANTQAIPAMLALAVLIPLAAGGFDLSVGATINLSAVLVAVLQVESGMGMWESIGLVLVICAVIGFINGFIVVKLKVSSLIATLGTTSLIMAVQTIISPTQPLPPTSQSWLDLGGRTILGGVQITVVYLLVLAVIVWWVMERTPAGRYLYAIGGNPDAARLSGVKVDKSLWSAFIASAMIAGVAGVLFCSVSGPSLSFGSGFLLPAFAAAFLGSTQLQPGRFTVWGTLLAIYVLATGVQGLQLATSQVWLPAMFNGVALIGAVSFAVWRQEHPAGSKRKDDADDAGGPAPGQDEELAPVGGRDP